MLKNTTTDRTDGMDPVIIEKLCLKILFLKNRLKF